MAYGPPTTWSKRLNIMLPLLLAADVAFFVIHVVHLTTPYLNGLLYSIEADGGFAEWFQYVQEYWCVLLLGWLWWRSRRPWALGWLLAFGYFLLDDAFTIHEIGGDIAYRHLGMGPALGLRAQDFGELLVSALAGAGLVLVNGLLYRRANAAERALSRDLAVMVVVLAFFAVGLDMLHSELQGTALQLTMGLFEDGGEMLTMSIICWYLLTVADNGGAAPDPTLVDRIRRRAPAGSS